MTKNAPVQHDPLSPDEERREAREVRIRCLELALQAVTLSAGDRGPAEVLRVAAEVERFLRKGADPRDLVVTGPDARHYAAAVP